jgi:hypothetical protein
VRLVFSIGSVAAGDADRSTASVRRLKTVTGVEIQIVRFVEAGQPDIVECSMTDAWGRKHSFIEKVPVVTVEDINETSSYPRRSAVACDVLRRWRDSDDREIVTVDTSKPWGIESTVGQTQFDVLASTLTEL